MKFSLENFCRVHLDGLLKFAQQISSIDKLNWGSGCMRQSESASNAVF